MAEHRNDETAKMESGDTDQLGISHYVIKFATLNCMIEAKTDLLRVLEDEGLIIEDHKPTASTIPEPPYSCQSQPCRQSLGRETKSGYCQTRSMNAKHPLFSLNDDAINKQNSQSSVFSMSATTPSSIKPSKELTQPKLPNVLPSKESGPEAMVPRKGLAPPPPPPPGVGKSLVRKGSNTRLKRSTKMPELFQALKGVMEESSRAVKSTDRRKMQLGGSPGGKEGLSASLAELTKRSTYFHQIEGDAHKYGKQIGELKVAINSFNTNDMVKLLKFQNNVESVLEVLTDESQVLAKFEGFPTKKLETLRVAAALHSKLETSIRTLKNWRVVPPLPQLLDKVDCYFRKIKLELDAFERNKDDEVKNFKSHNIDFDFHAFTRLREAMLDLSSNCMELALKERKEVRTTNNNVASASKTDQERRKSNEILWRVFQLAFRVYAFAGGQDDRADKLANELANEILVRSTD
ncbi:hypothetical protein K2173_009529 [Erythroxylum novogranatense]|uniref:Hydroxyproline-rich glycoprotein family protein n=1 Tax=Erythroxylum novogranatense TaxID=1862640 RepID=A0AAV8U6Y2_9ROSI|nr:hypothetical protein K2173_009529 [Erythroxylum novogranatense]